jgi:hypothetical protein
MKYAKKKKEKKKEKTSHSMQQLVNNIGAA